MLKTKNLRALHFLAIRQIRTKDGCKLVAYSSKGIRDSIRSRHGTPKALGIAVARP